MDRIGSDAVIALSAVLRRIAAGVSRARAGRGAFTDERRDVVAEQAARRRLRRRRGAAAARRGGAGVARVGAERPDSGQGPDCALRTRLAVARGARLRRRSKGSEL